METIRLEEKNELKVKLFTSKKRRNYRWKKEMNEHKEQLLLYAYEWRKKPVNEIRSEIRKEST